MKTLSSFALLILSFGLLVQADFTELMEVTQELGYGQCSPSRFNLLRQEQAACHEEDGVLTIQSLCYTMDIALYCIDNTLSECWTPQGLQKFKAATLRLLIQDSPVQVTTSEQIEELKSCPAYVEIFGRR